MNPSPEYSLVFWLQIPEKNDGENSRVVSQEGTSNLEAHYWGLQRNVGDTNAPKYVVEFYLKLTKQ